MNKINQFFWKINNVFNPLARFIKGKKPHKLPVLGKILYIFIYIIYGYIIYILTHKEGAAISMAMGH